jgi:hypothetical protein
MTSVAAVFLISTPFVYFADKASVERSQRAHDAWVKDNPPARQRPDGRLEFKFKLTNGRHITLEGDPGKTRDEAVDHLRSEGYDLADVDEPMVYDDRSSDSVFVLISGLAAFLIGRMFRYLVAGE